MKEDEYITIADGLEVKLQQIQAAESLRSLSSLNCWRLS